jgi:predicted ATPase/class 3 adenylate cyclase
VALTCRTCNAVANADAAFCASCGAALSAPPAERRLITVVFFDLVGSTSLSEMLDPEDMSELLDEYQACCVEAVESAGGSIQQYLGDGVLAYFGYPQAHEDDARRAVQAALQVVDSVARIEAPAGVPAIAARAGIHTGLVLVGEVGRGRHRENLAIGHTPNVAARVEGEAGPHQVAITSATLELVEGYFETEDMGAPELKGVKQKVGLHLVLAQTDVERRFEVAEKHGLTPFVGRDANLEVITTCWHDTEIGKGNALLLVGEPGIGKSRHVQIARKLAERASIMECFCHPDLRNSPLHPFTRSFVGLFGLLESDDPSSRFARIREYAERFGLGGVEDLSLLCNLMSVVPPPEHPPLGMSTARQYQRTLELVVTLINTLSSDEPLLLIVEDLHWADPTTLDALGMLLGAVSDTPLMFVATARPEFLCPWAEHPDLHILNLQRLGEAEVQEMILSLSGGAPLPPEVMEALVERCEGVPLIVEELTKAVLASELLVMDDQQLSVRGSLDDHVIPSTLQESLIARLDSLGESKQLAQIAAVFGKSFPVELLRTVTELPEREFESSLTGLLDADFVQAEADGFVFKHALLRDAAYDSVPRARRRELHARVARCYESLAEHTVQAHPELIAHHYSAGGDQERAAQLWLLAGQTALRRNAQVEAAELLRTALSALEGQPDSPERNLTELDVVMTLGPALINAFGYNAPEVETVCLRALELCSVVGDVPQRVPALINHWGFQCSRARHDDALALSATIMEFAEAAQSDELLLEGNLCVGISNLYLGNLEVAKAAFERVTALYDREAHDGHRFQYGNDPASIALSYLSLIHWFLGDEERSQDLSRESEAFARSLKHPFTEAFALGNVIHHRILCGDLAEAGRVLQETFELCEREAIPAIVPGVMAAYLQAANGDAAAPEALKGAADFSRLVGFLLLLPYIDATQADALSARGDHAEAEACLAASLETMNTTGERWAEAEIHRLHGQILERRGAAAAEIEGAYRLAVESARRMGAHGWKSRAENSRARWLESPLQSGGG